jgi:phosphate transport system protein
MTVLEQKLVELREKLMTMAAITEDMVSNSIKSLVNRESQLARQVKEVDEPRVNKLELEIEDAAINLIALHQPEASNLRTIAMIIKINNDLERLGDHAENIADAALFLIDRPPVKPLIDLPRMSEEAINMLKDVLNAFTKSDANLAKAVCVRDSVVDTLKSQIIHELITLMSNDPSTVDRSLKVMMVALNLERIADHATNIAEDVVYMATGEVIKHNQGCATP